ncbi:NifB/NifX family molybdenum-iron cluster-binding protein [Thermococcus paralvinellae]|nr:NifB/NifX family molybdenum-iron cluster-binding protein [Thermococcus paralvinellae]
MKIAVPSSANGGLDDTIAPVFARAPVFTIIEVENGEIKDVKTIQNPAVNAPSGAGAMAVQMLINEGIDTVIVPQFGPNALGAIQAAGIRVYTFQPGTQIKEAVESVIKGAPQTAQPQVTAPAYGPAYGFGYGWGRGRGWGRGGGRGGRGWGARLGYCPWTGTPNRRTLRWLYGWW